MRENNWRPYPIARIVPELSAVVYSPINDRIYLFGHPSLYPPDTTFCQSYNPSARVWSRVADLPTARIWMQAAYVRGKIYVVGGYIGSALNVNEEYDVLNNVWRTRRPMPSATCAYQVGVWRDSLIYVCGGTGPGLGGSNVVQVYNPFNDSWYTATYMPEAGDLGSGCVLGDTIYITNAYNRQMGQLWDTGRKGVINPSNPLSITWSRLAESLATLGFEGSTVEMGGWIYRVGGYATIIGPKHRRGWRYNPSTGQFETLPWLRNPDFATGFGGQQFITARAPVMQLFQAGGMIGREWQPDLDFFQYYQVEVQHDVGVSAVLEPPTPIVDSGIGIIPRVRIKNYGLYQERSFAVVCWIDSAGFRIYEDALLIDSLAAGDSIDVEFSTCWIPGGSLWQGYLITAFTVLGDDQVPFNDTIKMPVLITSDTLSSLWTTAPPLIDGYIDPNSEWRAAYFVRDISNVFGWQDGLRHGPDAARMRLMHDSSFFYLGIELPGSPTRDTGDKVAIFIDEDNDGEWEGNMSEGHYIIQINGRGDDEVLFYWHRPDTVAPQGNRFPDGVAASSIFNGYLCFEVKIPLGSLPYQLSLNPSVDTCGIWVWTFDNGGVPGYWRAGLPDSLGGNPAFYGKLLLSEYQPGLSSFKPAVGFPEIICPSPAVARKARVKLKSFGEGPVKVLIYDIAGRCVMRKLLSPPDQTRFCDISLNHLNPGIYMVIFDSKNVRRKTKIVIQ